MKFLFRHLLLLGVILGLAGQGVAFASSPCAEMQKEQAMSGPMAGMPDCAMGQHKSDNGSAPCKDMTPGCLAMTGCVALVAVDTLSPTIQAPLLVAIRNLWPTTPVLLGRSIAPDPDPPSLLG
ncbi:MAG: hypothetical protein QFC78_04280 [Pseudomonadota bacterium]|nr:hypothetical protein [Pseudomonadota bacterium]